MIDITGVNLTEFVKEVYNMSVPQGMGVIHFREGGLTDDEANSLIIVDGDTAVSMDYILGRACKMTVFRRDDNKLEIQDEWFDHTHSQFLKLLDLVNVKNKT